MLCPKGHKTVQKWGPVTTCKGTKQRFKCSTCGATFYRSGAGKPGMKPAPVKFKRSHKPGR